jgi:hypothetical protein
MNEWVEFRRKKSEKKIELIECIQLFFLKSMY